MNDRIPIPASALAGPSHADVMADLRGVYMQAISDIVDRVLAEVLLADDQAAVCLDVAQFTTYLMAVKIAEVRALPPTTENLMRWYWPMQKALKDEVPGMIRAHAAAVSGQ
jgi:hypothetical protein